MQVATATIAVAEQLAAYTAPANRSVAGAAADAAVLALVNTANGKPLDVMRDMPWLQVQATADLFDCCKPFTAMPCVCALHFSPCVSQLPMPRARRPWRIAPP